MKRLRFGKKQVSGTTVPQVSLLQTAIPSVSSLVLFSSLTEFPLKNYIDGVVNNNLSAIIKTGVCTDEDILIGAWTDITQEYSIAIGDHEQRLSLSLFKEINRLSIVIEQIGMAVRVLEKYYVKEFADSLNSILTTSLQFNVSDPEGYTKDLQRCLNRSKGYQIQMDLKAGQFKAIKDNQKPGSKPTREYFQSILITLSDHAGFRVEDSITLFEFCERIKRLNKQLEDASK